jgi:hypothetical protein
MQTAQEWATATIESWKSKLLELQALPHCPSTTSQLDSLQTIMEGDFQVFQSKYRDSGGYQNQTMHQLLAEQNIIREVLQGIRISIATENADWPFAMSELWKQLVSLQQQQAESTQITERLSRRMLNLTWVIAIIGLLTVGAGFIQAWAGCTQVRMMHNQQTIASTTYTKEGSH